MNIGTGLFLKLIRLKKLTLLLNSFWPQQVHSNILFMIETSYSLLKHLVIQY